MRRAAVDRGEGPEKAHFPVAVLCRVLAVSRAGYCAWQQRAASARARADAALSGRIRAVHAGSRGTSGAPRVHAQLRAEGLAIGRKRVARLLRAAGLAGVVRGCRRPRTTVADGGGAALSCRGARRLLPPGVVGWAMDGRM